jgi:hypothetical protein
MSVRTQQQALRNAVEQAKLAYLFKPNSYTHSAWVALMAAHESYDDWIEQFVEWNERK